MPMHMTVYAGLTSNLQAYLCFIVTVHREVSAVHAMQVCLHNTMHELSVSLK